MLGCPIRDRKERIGPLTKRVVCTLFVTVQPSLHPNKGSIMTEAIINAAELLRSDHPLHASFVQWAKGKPLTKRQARKFLAAHPMYREVQRAA